MNYPFKQLIILTLLTTSLKTSVFAQSNESLLTDKNGDGTVKIAAFGDSITYGVGDGGLSTDGNLNPDSGGYPGRLSNYLSVPVENLGNPGERITIGGFERFPQDVGASNADTVIIMEGVNDVNEGVNTTDYRTALQTLINVADSSGKNVMLVTLPAPGGEHENLDPGVTAFNLVIQDVAAVNGLTYADLNKGWSLACKGVLSCTLYNLPEGLHPTSKGYKAVAQSIAAGILGIDIVAGSASSLASALNISESEVLIK